jgi:hypothetical protein
VSKFNEKISRYKEYLKLAELDLIDIKNGITHSIDGVDKTSELMKRAEYDIDLFSRLIAAYEKKEF